MTTTSRGTPIEGALLTVTDTFDLRDLGVVVSPAVDAQLVTKPAQVRFEAWTVDGRVLSGSGRIDREHSRRMDGTSQWRWVLVGDAGSAELPTGATIALTHVEPVDAVVAAVAPQPGPRLALITPAHALYASELDLRFRVLREPLGRTRAEVAFPFEGECLHLVAVDAGHVAGCVLFHFESAQSAGAQPEPAHGRLLQMAVDPALQGRGLGRRLVQALEEVLQRRGVHRVHLHARATVVGFYEKLGYAVEGAPFSEVGIEHRHMARALERATQGPA